MKRILIVLLFAFIGWAICGAIIGIGYQITSQENTLIFHAIAVPLIFGFLSWVYFKKFNQVTPLQMASICLAFVLIMDFFVAAMLIQGNFEMFKSILGTWIPFLLIFLSTYYAGKKSRKDS